MINAIVKVIIIVSSIALVSCETKRDEPLKIVTNAWIGYSPLFYAKAKGWIDPAQFKLVHVVSLGESLQLFETGNAHLFTGTQYEFNQVLEKDSSVIPIVLFDRSFGSDMIMSNRTLEQLKNETRTIDAFMEVDSVNSLIFNDFIARNNLGQKKIRYINKDQASISTVTLTDESRPTIAVTYVPYNAQLKKQGFIEISNTRDSMDLMVLDALYTKQSTYTMNKEKFVQLKNTIDKALHALETNPKEYFEKVSQYLGDLPYDEFQIGVQGIQWLDKPLDPNVEARIRDSGFPLRDLL